MVFLRQIEEKWQLQWEKEKAFEADPDPSKPKFFITFPYPYMNGPLHVGHGFTAGRVDAYARFKRMQGYCVLFPWAWHWTGQPLIGASERVAKGDDAFIRSLREVDGVPEPELKRFVDPLYMAQYYTNEARVAVKRIGFSVDWRREFNTVMPAYQRFVTWQYQKLRELGYVTRGTHPVVWCPRDKSPTGDADRQVGEGVNPEEYTLIKFRLGHDTFLPAATFRPETIYGVTNMWINPDSTYVEAKIDSETWIISRQAAQKLAEQGKKVSVKRDFKGRELIGKSFENPVTHGKLLILPGWFVDPSHATGVVYSVPAHAPYDWLALRDLQKNAARLKEFNIDSDTVLEIKPVPLIKLAGYGDFPAIELVNEMGITDQNDPRADEATKLLYKKEFHSGVLNDNCREYSGRLVRDVKETLIEDLKTRGLADFMFDLPQEVVCRCMTPCIVKVLQDQWFLNYSDKDWKGKVRQALGNMTIYPDSARQWFTTVIDWLREWACARTTGFGTPLPWGKGWIIETLSDSTIYMSFYTIKKSLDTFGIKPEMLTADVFDHIFFGLGEGKQVAARSGIDLQALKEMREEFTYWYPVDLRVSAKELLPNHLTFFVFHHTALFPPEHWPKAMGVNGMLMIEGKQMHKSKGNFITLKNAVQNYGADATRCTLLLAAEGMDDPDWRSENASDTPNKLESFYDFVKGIIESQRKKEDTRLEKWLLSSMQRRVAQVTENMDQMKTRTALEIALFEIWNDLRWYIRRKKEIGTEALHEAVGIWLKLLAPFVPHICEELWSLTGERGFVSLREWPKFDEGRVDLTAEEEESVVKELIDDTLSVLKATGMTPYRIHYYVADEWKWKVYMLVTERSLQQEGVDVSSVMRELSKNPDLRRFISEAAKLVPKFIKEISQTSEEHKRKMLCTGVIDEFKAIKEALTFLNERFSVKSSVYRENDENRYDPKKRATTATPLRPAIFVEQKAKNEAEKNAFSKAK